MGKGNHNDLFLCSIYIGQPKMFFTFHDAKTVNVPFLFCALFWCFFFFSEKAKSETIFVETKFTEDIQKYKEKMAKALGCNWRFSLMFNKV